MTLESGTPFFSKNGWPFVVISLGAILRGLFYLPALSGGYTPYGLELIVGSSRTLFAVYCFIWIAAGLIGLASSFVGNRVIAIPVMVALCALWTFGYLVQFTVDIATWDFDSGVAYIGGVTYASLGAALFRFPAKG